ncbi:MAG: glycosyltransferase family 4 protein [Streptomyces sp.]|uniref:glycosyltransferase family 4 protein n=1 Tax=Streptomyces sp. TaxID=1931 RepID=UPI0025E97262|nr:glycosyltransferase family 1 protein [Streptomyces sp.]MBW8792215.1 glycosyltransferase family 4 protein [Streptomyces sp.]
MVDGRVLGGQATGIQRVARGLLDAAGDLPRLVLAPHGTRDPRVDRQLPVRQGRLWEQVVLPAVAGRRLVLSLANTAPLAARHSAVLVHDLAPLLHPEWFHPRMRLYARAVSAAARRADIVLVPSRAVAEELAAVLGVTGAAVVRPAVEGSPATPAAVEELRARFGLHRRYAVLVGWGDPRKDAGTAVAAHRLVRTAVPHDLVLIGEAHPNLATVQRPPDDTVRVLGRLSDADLGAVITGADVLLHPSVYEGFGLPPLEAWVRGTPALAADVAAVREATEGQARLLPPRDVAAWAAALEAALTVGLPVPDLPRWSWGDAGVSLRSALGG